MRVWNFIVVTFLRSIARLAALRYRKWWRTSFYKGRMLLTPLCEIDDLPDTYIDICIAFKEHGVEFYEDFSHVYKGELDAN